MIIKALNTFGGILDLSAMERLQESNPYEKYPFRLYIRPGESVEVDDKFYNLTRIQQALSLGYIEIGNISSTPKGNNSLVDPSYSGTTMTQIAGENLVFGDIVYYGSDEKVYKAKANSLSTMICIGVVVEGALANNNVTLLVDGLIRSSALFNFTAGSQASSNRSIVYVSATESGKVTQCIPDAYPNIVQIIGYATTSNIMAFKPDYTYIETNIFAGSSSSSSSSSSSGG